MEEGKKDSFPFTKKDNFRGFFLGQGTSATDIKAQLGIDIPPDVRTFYYKQEPRTRILQRFLAGLGNKPEPDIPFLTDTEHRGAFSSEHKAIFVRPGDTFAELHEAGHSFVAQTDPEFEATISEGWEKVREVKDKVARYALDEGIPQWIAVATSFGVHTPESLVIASEENNKMVGVLGETSEMTYSKDAVFQKVTRVKERADAFIEEKRRTRNKDAKWQNDANADFVAANFRDLISLGYVYVSSAVEEQMKEQDFDLPSALVEVIKNPPTYDEFMKRIAGYDGEQSFFKEN